MHSSFEPSKSKGNYRTRTSNSIADFREYPIHTPDVKRKYNDFSDLPTVDKSKFRLSNSIIMDKVLDKVIGPGPEYPNYDEKTVQGIKATKNRVISEN